MDVKARLSRLLFLIAYINRHQGIEIEKLASLLRCSRRDVMKELDLLSVCGVPPFSPDDLFMVRAEGGRAYLDIDQRMGKPLQLTGQEAVALIVCLKIIIAAGGEPLSSLAGSALEKLKAALSEDTGEKARQQDGRLLMEADGKEIGERFKSLRSAIARKLEVQMTYYTASRDEMSERCVQPLLLSSHQGYWYLVAKCLKKNSIQIFKVDRMRDVVVTDKGFEPPGDFDEEKYAGGDLFKWKGEEKRAKVRFLPPALRMLGQLLKKAGARNAKAGETGEVVELSTAAFAGLVPYLFWWGEHFEVMEPAELRSMVRDRANEMLALYRRAGGETPANS